MPTRSEVVEFARNQKKPFLAKELAKHFDLKTNMIIHHLTDLYNDGLIQRDRDNHGYYKYQMNMTNEEEIISFFKKHNNRYSSLSTLTDSVNLEDSLFMDTFSSMKKRNFFDTTLAKSEKTPGRLLYRLRKIHMNREEVKEAKQKQDVVAVLENERFKQRLKKLDKFIKKIRKVDVCKRGGNALTFHFEGKEIYITAKRLEYVYLAIFLDTPLGKEAYTYFGSKFPHNMLSMLTSNGFLKKKTIEPNKPAFWSFNNTPFNKKLFNKVTDFVNNTDNYRITRDKMMINSYFVYLDDVEVKDKSEDVYEDDSFFEEGFSEDEVNEEPVMVQSVSDSKFEQLQVQFAQKQKEVSELRDRLTATMAAKVDALEKERLALTSQIQTLEKM